jgi:tetratricopeptide (TPR) repeat protein
MNAARIEMLEKFMEDDPTDPFPIYALALEYQVTEPSKTRQLFEQLLSAHADYLPTYYMAGNFFLEQGEVERATGVLQLGLKLAKKKSDRGTIREIQAVIDSLEN